MYVHACMFAIVYVHICVSICVWMYLYEYLIIHVSPILIIIDYLFFIGFWLYKADGDLSVLVYGACVAQR